MWCPVCQEVTLVVAHRQGIEVDYCPRCRGVWLDRGELDKLIERATPLSPPWTPERHEPDRRESRDYPRRRDDGDDHDYRGEDYRRRKKRGFLGEVFDFD
jgi:Zn-finger nucleic acid-binding protein